MIDTLSLVASILSIPVIIVAFWYGTYLIRKGIELEKRNRESGHSNGVKAP